MHYFGYNIFMKASQLTLLIIFLLFSACQEVGDNKPILSDKHEKQPIIIINKNRHLNIAEFWIDQQKSPDTIIMNEKKIEQFNNDTAYEKKTLTYFQDIPTEYDGAWIKMTIEVMFNGLKNRTKYFEDGQKISNDFYSKIKEEMYLDVLYGNPKPTRYALTVNYTNQKIIPSTLALLKEEKQIHFDRNQNSALDIGTPLAILHGTSDGLWYYGIGPTSSGWVESKNIAFGERDEIANYLHTEEFIITTSAKNPLMIKGHYHDYTRMGVRLPYVMNIDDMTMVLIPSRNNEGKLVLSNATIKTDNTHKGYLPYTPRTVLTQAFKFLNAPYGWGGMYGEQDCSKFLQQVYATTGVLLPRNSTSQSNVGSSIVELSGLTNSSKIELLNSVATIGSTLLHLDGHIVLYLGEYKGEPYIIHTVWGESEEHFALGRTAVTSLNFNDYLTKIDKATAIEMKIEENLLIAEVQKK